MLILAIRDSIIGWMQHRDSWNRNFVEEETRRIGLKMASDRENVTGDNKNSLKYDGMNNGTGKPFRVPVFV